MLLIVSYVLLRGRKEEKKQETKISILITDTFSANETIRVSPIGTLMKVRLYLMWKNARERSLQIKRGKKRCRLIGGRHSQAKEPIIIIAPVNPGSPM